MKTIFRYANIGLLLAAIMALGAVAAIAQNPCEDAEGMTALGDSVRAKYSDKTINGRKAFLEVGKQFLEKYASCDPGKDLGDWLKGRVPAVEKQLADQIEAEEKGKLIGRFDAGLRGKNWDQVFVSGKEILAKYPDEFRVVEIVFGALAGEEAFKGNFKYTSDGLRYAKDSIADLEAGKSFTVGADTRYGLSLKDSYNFEFANKNDAIGWMHLYAGYMAQMGQKNKPAALPHLYKATQGTSEAAKQPVPFELIGSYYFDELNKLVERIQTAAKDQNETDTPEVAQKKVDDIRALVALSNGVAERAMDAFSRAYALGKTADYKTKMKKNVEGAYKLRFAKEEGVDAWIAGTMSKPFPDPTTPVMPISDPEPAKTDAASTTTTPAAAVKPAAAPIKPAVKPGVGSNTAAGTKQPVGKK
ncbi:MAG: hypothetical protein WBO10_02985 [Pyrinomonadaceae bacterium]